MRRTTLDRYLGRDPPAVQVSFLDMPYAIRRRIYVYTGLLRFCLINLNMEGVNKGQVSNNPYILSLDDLTNVCNYKAKQFHSSRESLY